MLVGKKDYSVGIMQGRLTPSRGRGIQFFPFDEWHIEFPESDRLGLDEIEFIFDLDSYSNNPLWRLAGINEINMMTSLSNIKIRCICADFFMRRPFFRVGEGMRGVNIRILKNLVWKSHGIGARNIEIPLLDNSSLKTGDDERLLIESLNECMHIAKSYGLTISLESDLPPDKFARLLESFSGSIGAVYDCGNSASLGYDPIEEIKILGRWLTNVHIKDRAFGGGTVPLGTGSADFDRIFEALNSVGYQEGFILQAARGEDGKETETVRGQINFLKKYLKLLS